MADEQTHVPPPGSEKALAEVMGMTRHEMTQFEARAWITIMCSVPEEQFLAYLQQHVFTGSGFAPKPSEAAKVLELTIDADSAYAKVERLVREFGPYQEPPISDPVLVMAISYMGGWVALNAQMPEPNHSFAAKSMRERFEGCFHQAMNAVRIRGEKPERPLLCLASPRPAPLPALQHRAAPQLPEPEAARSTSISRQRRFGRTPV